jgi:UDP-4-amino-4,6-dideoxy-N-acetyl-beta-L-altrosamine transaminase
MIPYGRQWIDAHDEAAVLEVLRSDFLTQGPAVPRFEQAICDATGARHAVAVNSATSALHIACLALGLGPGDRLWTSPNTFVASANCGRLCGAEVDFVAIDPKTLNMDPAALADKLATAEREGTLPKVVVPVDFAGLPAELPAFRRLADRYGFRIVDDASHAIGAVDGERRVGAGGLADVTVFSFHPVKIITTGEGGAAVTDDPELAHRMQLCRTHGITRDPAKMRGASEGPWYYQQLDLGLNYRMTDLQAALGTSQICRLKEFIRRRTELADRYDTLLSELPVIPAPRCPGKHSAWHLYVIQLFPEYEARRLAIFEAMRDAGIGVNVHYIPVHLHPYYRSRGFAEGQFPCAERYYRRAITLPLFPGLSDSQQFQVVASLEEAIVG